MSTPLSSPWLRLLLLLFGFVCLLRGESSQVQNQGAVWASNAIQNVPLNAALPLFVPTHPRVTTTIRFPSAIGAPDGRGFTEDELKQPGEYLVSWIPGESHFTLTPLANAGPLNLNVPYKGATYVFYFYPVDQQFQALACLNLSSSSDGQAGGADPKAQGLPSVLRSKEMPKKSSKALSPASALGLMDRLKALRPHVGGARFKELAAGLHLEAQSCSTPVTVRANADPAQPPMLDYGIYGVGILLLGRDVSLDGLAFAVLIKNQSKDAIAFDVASIGARLGADYFPQILSDVPPILSVGESREAYFVIQGAPGAASPALAEWKVSLDLISPRLPPGAAAVSDYLKTKP